jgi:CHASE3 domain sensor protein
LFNSGALKAANARVASLEAELKASRTAFDAATAAKVNTEKSAKSALAKAKKAEKDLANANKEHLQREHAVAERLNQMSAAVGGTYYTFFHFVGFLALLCLLMYSFSSVLLFAWFCRI